MALKKAEKRNLTTIRLISILALLISIVLIRFGLQGKRPIIFKKRIKKVKYKGIDPMQFKSTKLFDLKIDIIFDNFVVYRYDIKNTLFELDLKTKKLKFHYLNLINTTAKFSDIAFIGYSEISNNRLDIILKLKNNNDFKLMTFLNTNRYRPIEISEIKENYLHELVNLLNNIISHPNPR